jgi:mannosyltransferase OCH1-like enzyme
MPIYLLVAFLYFLFVLLFRFGPPSWMPSSEATPDIFKHILSQQSASVPKGPFPKKFWQIWKVPPLHFEEKELQRARNWTQMNPTYRYEVLTDDNGVLWVEQAYGPNGLNRPDVVNFYQSFDDHIIKADFLRYLIMYYEGGTYADIDVSALKPIDTFIPDQYKGAEEDIDMVVGVEVDQPQYKDHPILGSKSMSFVQWTFMCKPRLPVMLKLINDIIVWINGLADEQHVPISNVTINFDQVISGSGPTKFTLAILSEMAKKQGSVVEWNTFHNMTEPKLLGGVLVLPVKAFAAGQGHSNSGKAYCPEANIKHHYHASKWPLTHPRYKHPIFGQLEDCSWNSSCIAKWEEKVALFNNLSPEVQAKELKRRKQGHEARLAREAKEEKQAKLDASNMAEKTVDGFCAQRFPNVLTKEVLDTHQPLGGQQQDVSIPKDQAAKKPLKKDEIEKAAKAEEEADAALLEEWRAKMSAQREQRRIEREADLAAEEARLQAQ